MRGANNHHHHDALSPRGGEALLEIYHHATASSEVVLGRAHPSANQPLVAPPPVAPFEARALVALVARNPALVGVHDLDAAPPQLRDLIDEVVGGGGLGQRRDDERERERWTVPRVLRYDLVDEVVGGGQKHDGAVRESCCLTTNRVGGRNVTRYARIDEAGEPNYDAIDMTGRPL